MLTLQMYFHLKNLGGIDEAFNKPPEFTYKNTVEKIEREKKNV